MSVPFINFHDPNPRGLSVWTALAQGRSLKKSFLPGGLEFLPGWQPRHWVQQLPSLVSQRVQEGRRLEASEGRKIPVSILSTVTQSDTTRKL